MTLKKLIKNYILENKMKKIIYLIIFFLGLQNFCAACDVLDINIGGDKSEAEEYFGPIEIEEENKELVTIFTGEAETFCPDSDFGSTFVNMYILEDKVVGVSLQVQNGPDNEESARQVLYNYVIARYGDIENSSLNLRGKKIKPSTVKLLNDRFGGSQIRKVITSRRNIRKRKTYENDIGIWDVSYLVDERDNNGTKEYLVRWKDYNEDADTWESEDRILSKDLITKYNNKFHMNDLSNELYNMDHEMDGDN